MPKSAFFNLPISKQQELIAAAKREFSRHLLVDASVNQIIKDIGMPRGTFYLYFENKQELYHYVIKEYMDKIEGKLKQLLKHRQGDIIDSFIDLYDYLLNHCFEGYETLLKNIFLNMNYYVQNTVIPRPSKEEIQAYFEDLFSLVDQSKLNLSSDHDFLDIFYILKSIMFHAISENFSKEAEKEEIRSRYIHRLALLKNGIYRKEENN